MIFNKVFAPPLWLGYQTLARLPFSTREAIVSEFVSRRFSGRMPKIEGNIRLIRSDLNGQQIEQAIERLKEITIENYAILLGSRTLDIRKKEMSRLEVTGNLEEVMGLYRHDRKLIVVAPHVGPYDLELFLFTRHVSDALAPLKLKAYIPAEALLLEAITTDLRKVAGDHIIFGRVKKGETLGKAAEYLNHGCLVAFGFDMVRENSRGVACRIGDNAMGVFPAGWAVLARRENAVVVPIFPCVTTEGMILVLVGTPFTPKKTKNEREDIENSVRMLVKLYDPFFRNNIDQWMQIPNIDLKKWDNSYSSN